LVDAGDFAEVEFAAEAFFVNGFDEAWAFEAVDFGGGADDLVGEFIGFNKEWMHGEVLQKGRFARKFFT